LKYQKFLHAVKAEITQILGDSADTILHKVSKNNGVYLDSITIMFPKEQMAPSIYMNQFYEEYKRGKSISQIVKEVVIEGTKREDDFSLESNFLTDFQKMKGKIAYKFINYEKNLRLLNEVPHIRILDLAIVFFCVLRDKEIEFATIDVCNYHMELWSTNKEELYELAIKNTPLLLPGVFQNMEVVMTELLELEKEEIEKIMEEDKKAPPLFEQIKKELAENSKFMPMYVMTNGERTFGAISILYSRVLEKISHYFQSDIYILPSSIHECIIVPFCDRYTKEELAIMVKEINETQVATEEVLSNKVYIYSRQSKELSQ
jgi:hypothetical protein